MGLFWNELRDRYPKCQDAAPIEPQIEPPGSKVPQTVFPKLRIAAAQPAARLQMLSDDDHTMVQIQNGRLVYNWRRHEDAEYPRWRMVEPRFQAELKRFEDFLDSQGLDQMEPNQWEVTYVNHLIRGREWHDQSDWPDLLPGLIGDGNRVSSADFESHSCHSHFALPNDTGRLHVVLTHGFTGFDNDAQESLFLQLTARGGIDPSKNLDLAAGLALGRTTIVRSFAELTGKKAHEMWEREP